MRTQVEDNETNLPTRLQNLCCNTPCKQVTWGVNLIFFVILFVAMGGYYSRLEADKTFFVGNATLCETQGDFETSERLSLQVVTIIGAVFSMLGSSFIIISFFAFKDLQTFPYKLIMFLSVADFFSSSTYILAVQDLGINPEDKGTDCFEDNFMCFFTAGMSQYFDFASFLWMGVISFNIYQIMVKRVGEGAKDFEKIYHLVCWGVPAFFLIIVTATDGLGDAGNWCWIKHDHQVERWLCYYIPLMIVMGFNCATYCAINRATKKLNMRNQEAVNRRMVLYVGAFLFLRSWSVLNRFVELVDGNVGVFPLMFLHSMFSPVQGLANALVYGFNKKTKGHYYNLCCGNRNSREIIEEEEDGDRGNPLHVEKEMETPNQRAGSQSSMKSMDIEAPSGNDPL